MSVYDRAALARDLGHLFRLPLGDKLSLTHWYTEAQGVARRARDAGLVLPPEVTAWLASADRRAKDPVLGAAQSADVARFIAQLQA
jgi:hypothetical protein